MRKSDIIFENGGLFSTKERWIHCRRPAGCPSNELILVTGGVVFLQVAELRLTLREGDFALLPPGTPHGGWKESGEPVAFYWLHFYGDAEGGHGKLPAPSLLVQNARQLLQMQDTPGYPEGAADHMMAVILAELAMQRRRQTVQNALAARAHEYVRAHAYRPLTAAGVAAELGYHPDHLSRVLRACYGRSLQQEINGERLNRARLLLQTTDWTVAQIALELGYTDPNLFEKFFRYHQQVTPTEYRSSFSRMHTNHL